MATRIERKTYVQRSVGPGTDLVIGGVNVPEGGVLHNVVGEIHLISGASVSLAIQAVMYGLEGWLVSGFDPDSSDSYDDLWDRYVPKDEDVSESAGADQIDLDTGVVIASQAFEPGEPRLEALIGAMPAGRFYRREKVVSFATSKGGFDKTAEDYIPTDALVPFGASIEMGADDWSVGLLAVSSPSQDDVGSAIFVSPTGSGEWMALKYIDDVIEAAWKQLVGLTEATAESPFGPLATILEAATEPSVVEEDASRWDATTWDVFARLVWSYSVPGSYNKRSLSSS